MSELNAVTHSVREESASSGASGVAVDDELDGVADDGRHRRAPRIRELEQTCVLLQLETDLRSDLHRLMESLAPRSRQCPIASDSSEVVHRTGARDPPGRPL